MQGVLDTIRSFLDVALYIVLFLLVLELRRDMSEVKAMLKRLSQPPEAGSTQPTDR